MMKKLIVILLLVLSFDTISQANLKFFDQEMIVKYKIKSIWESVYRKERGNKERAPCPNIYYTFDKRGNILTHGLGRLDTIYGYKYNDENKMIDFYWQDRSSKKIEMSYSEEYLNDLIKIKQELKPIETRLRKMLEQKIDFRNNATYSVSDVCAWINADYNISVVNETDGLPSILKGEFIKEFDDWVSPEKPVSPKGIYIYYDYEFYK